MTHVANYAASYSVDGCAVVQRRAAPDQIDLTHGCVVALLAKAPTPEGGAIVEVAGRGYERQPVRLARKSAASVIYRSLDDVDFGRVTDDWSQPSHVAIFDAAGQPVGYGRLARTPGHSLPGFVHFGTDAISLSFTS